LGLQRAGMEIVWQVEIDPWCQKILEKHWPGVPKYGDIKSIKTLPPVDLICGGFPCQPASQAGKRRGQSDERWLWPEFHRIIRTVKPTWVLAENVPGLLSVNLGSAFGEMVGDLASSGYRVEWDCLPASAFGAPHRRDRVWVVAHANHAGEGTPNNGSKKWEESGSFFEPGGSGAMAHADSIRYDEGESQINPAESGEPAQPRPTVSGTGWKTDPADDPQSGMGRVVDGLPRRVDRLRGLGNAVVPQVVEWIGRRIIESHPQLP